MAFLVRHYEKLVLGFLLLAVLGWSYWRLDSINQGGLDMQEMRQRMGTGPVDSSPMSALTADNFLGLKAFVGTDIMWQPKGDTSQGTLFDAARYISCANPACAHILPFAVNVCPYCKAEQGPEETQVAESAEMDSDGDGLPDAYENKYKFLDRNNPGDANLDEDNDGFTNVEEFQAGTNPADPVAHPPFAAKLRFVKAARSPLPVTVEKITRNGNDVKAWQIQFSVLENGRRVSRFARVGETVGGFAIVEVQPKMLERIDPKVKTTYQEDVSEVIMRRGQEETIVLTRAQQKYEKGVKAELLFLPDLAGGQRDRALRTVAVGEKFTLTVASGRKESYVLTKVSDRDAVVAPVSPSGELGAEITVPLYRRGSEARRARASSSVPGRARLPAGFPGLPPGMMPPGLMPRR